MSEIKLRKGESVDRALKKLKSRLEREGTFDALRERRYYKKPSVRKRERKKKAKFEAYLQSKRDKRWR
jgi:small subunit ribosomal protein S21